MKKQPRIGYAKRQGTTRIHQPGRFLPIILVPGISGSRLVNDKGKLVWNPLGKPLGDSPGTFTVKLKDLESDAPLYPDESHGYEEQEKREEVEHIKHFNNLVSDFYKDLALSLSRMEGEFVDYRVKPRVYCCGYDWRQDCAKSALRLAEVVEEALRDTRERRVVIVAHSMGGLVARYYCRILGGEAKVHQLFLLGSPTMGAPTAFVQLKQGISGFYAKDLVEDAVQGNALGIVAETADVAGRAMTMIGRFVEGAAGAGAMGFFGDLYLVLSMAKGKFLTRDESIRFARKMTALYQLMPGAAFCSQNKNWVIFDPLATGHKPVGHMVIFPTLLDGLTEVVNGVAELGTGGAAEGVKDDIDAFFKEGREERNSPLATRNVTTLQEILEVGIEAIAEMTEATGQLFEHGFTDEVMATYGEHGKEIARVGGHLADQIGRTFVDCASNKKLYNDIYTGLLDIIDLRAMAAGRLALAYRFDEALTVKKPPNLSMTAADLLLELIGPVLNEFQAVGLMFKNVFDTGDFDTAYDQGQQEVQEQTEAREQQRSRKPKMYMHPRTVNIYSNAHRVESGCWLLPTDVRSNYDSNEVVSKVIPNFVAMAISLVASNASSIEASWFGDGTVPATSANPDASLLSHDFLNEGGEQVSAAHASIPKNSEALQFIERRMQGLLMSYLNA
jgi:pimeloyl-ACP methyl ester carboxylesterase